MNGFFDPVSGKIYIVADAHRNGAEAVRTLLHEAVGEYGIDRVLPAKDWAQIRRSLLGHPLAREVSQTYAGTRDIGSLPPEQQDQVARETLSKMAEDPSSGGRKFSRVIPLLKAALRRMGIKYAYSHADLMYIVERARKTVARESTVQVEGEGDVRFSLQDQVEGNAAPASANSNTAQQTTLERGSRQITGASPVQGPRAAENGTSSELPKDESGMIQALEDSQAASSALSVPWIAKRYRKDGSPLDTWDRLTGPVRDLVIAAHKAVAPTEREITKVRSLLFAVKNKNRSRQERTNLIESLEELMKLASDRAREAIKIPKSEQGIVKLPLQMNGIGGDWDPALGQLPFAGAEIVQFYTHPALLPTITNVIKSDSTRPSYENYMIEILPTTPVSLVAHEITHGTEQQNPGILKAAQDFLENRRINNEEPQLLSRLTGIAQYDINKEMAYEDHWLDRGADPYTGKVMAGGFKISNHTEILTMGIERLHAEPLRFARLDPNHFSFVVNTLRKW